jgi:CDP-diacylglycerol pyrophosphatase
MHAMTPAAPRHPARPATAGRQFCPTLAAFVLSAACALVAPSARAESSALWHIVHDQCVPHQQANEGAAPCREVALPAGPGGTDAGHVILKDRRGVLQFLLIPTRRSSGIDDPALLQPGAPPYWAQAWAARRYMDELRGQPVPRDVVSLTINSAAARSQDQLHIHISCVREDLRARLLAAQSQIGTTWQPLAGGWMGHPYWVRRIVASTLDGEDPFRDVAQHVPGAAQDMGRQTIGVVGARFADGRDGFFVMAGSVEALAGSRGSAEYDLQDHDCAVLPPVAASAARP